MGHTRVTANHNLPQFDPTDKPSFLGDINAGFARTEDALNILTNANAVQESTIAAQNVTIAALTARVAALEAAS